MFTLLHKDFLAINLHNILQIVFSMKEHFSGLSYIAIYVLNAVLYPFFLQRQN